jgi:organic radical activating enzyme
MQLKLKQLIDEDFVNYKVPSMFIAFPHCTMKCGKDVCQNSALLCSPSIDISVEDLLKRYSENPISKALVIGGLEPFDDYEELLELVTKFRERFSDDIVIYSGYYPEELQYELRSLTSVGSIIIKFGRFLNTGNSRYDDILGVTLSGDNQYAVLYN